jgi:hypothetical protein
MSNDSAQGRAVGTHPGSFSGGRDRPQFVLSCLNGAVGPSQPSVVAPEYQELAAKRAREKERVDNCQKQATEQRVLPRDRPQFVISCLEK